MSPVPVYRVVSMEADLPSNIYNHQVVLQPIDEREVEDLSAGRVDSDGYEKGPLMRVNITEEVFHSLRVGMYYQIAFSSSNLQEVA